MGHYHIIRICSVWCHFRDLTPKLARVCSHLDWWMVSSGLLRRENLKSYTFRLFMSCLVKNNSNCAVPALFWLYLSAQDLIELKCVLMSTQKFAIWLSDFMQSFCWHNVGFSNKEYWNYVGNHRIAEILDFAHRSVFKITRKRKVSETKSVSVLRREGWKLTCPVIGRSLLAFRRNMLPPFSRRMTKRFKYVQRSNVFSWCEYLHCEWGMPQGWRLYFQKIDVITWQRSEWRRGVQTKH
jgi:hypothetical protein